MENTPYTSEETAQKQEDFTKIIGKEVNVCDRIFKKYPQFKDGFWYFDLYGGCGSWRFNGKVGDGSPIIFRDTADEVGIPYEARAFEKEPQLAKELMEHIGVRENFKVYNDKFEEKLIPWLSKTKLRKFQYGLAYADPPGTPIPVRAFQLFAEKLPKVDLLAYIAATNYKRVRGANPDAPYLEDHVNSIDKKYKLIREKSGAFEFTFILWTNWVDWNDYKSIGLYRLDSPKGQEILRELNFSKKERGEK